MVKVCSITSYPKENEPTYKSYFEKYEYPLHIFQKYAIEAIVEGNHVLVTAPTGSGKTLPGDFSIDFFHSKGKKVIYTTPIKALIGVPVTAESLAVVFKRLGADLDKL